MSLDTIISGSIALAALILSIINARGQHRMRKREEYEKKKAKVKVEIQRGQPLDYLIFINDGPADALNVDIVPSKNSEGLYISNDENNKLPIKLLQPGCPIAINLIHRHKAPSVYQAFLSWENPDKTKETKEVTLYYQLK